MKHSNATRWALAGALLLGLPAAAAAQVIGPGFIPNDNTAYGTTSGEFLLLGGGARGTALGNAYAALAGDVSALYYNPAGIAQMNRPQAQVGSYNYVAVSCSARLSPWRCFLTCCNKPRQEMATALRR